MTKLTTNEPKRLVHPERAAEMLDMSKRRVRALVHAGHLVGVRAGGPRSLRITVESIDRFIERNKVGA